MSFPQKHPDISEAFKSAERRAKMAEETQGTAEAIKVWQQVKKWPHLKPIHKKFVAHQLARLQITALEDLYELPSPPEEPGNNW